MDEKPKPTVSDLLEASDLHSKWFQPALRTFFEKLAAGEEVNEQLGIAGRTINEVVSEITGEELTLEESRQLTARFYAYVVAFGCLW